MTGRRKTIAAPVNAEERCVISDDEDQDHG